MDPSALHTTGEKLRYYRTNCELSQKQVADALKIDRTAYTYYETGRSLPSINTIVKLAKIFCVEPSALLPQEGYNSGAVVSDVTAVTDPLSIYTLSKDERSLIAMFRVLPDSKKQDILAFMTNINK